MIYRKIAKCDVFNVHLTGHNLEFGKISYNILISNGFQSCPRLTFVADSNISALSAVDDDIINFN